jgi:hypothetical protein
MTCPYGQMTCDCVSDMWTCTGGGVDGGGNCPMDAPGPGDPCTMQDQLCVYDSGHTRCTCDTTDGWSCTAMSRR